MNCNKQIEREGGKGGENLREKIWIILGCLVLLVGMVVLNVTIVEQRSLHKNKQENVMEDGTRRNVWIIKGEGQELTAIVNGEKRTFPLKQNIEKIESVVADLKIKKGTVTRILLKEDRIKGKILAMEEDLIKIDGYGSVPMEKEFRVYALYKEQVEELGKNTLPLGSETVDFFVAKGKISAGLLLEEPSRQEIRVLIRNGESEYFSGLKLTATTDFVVKNGKKESTHKKNEPVTISKSQGKEGRMVITPKGEGKVTLLSVKKSSGTPSYRGTIEITQTKKGFQVVNELPLEQYLYAVIGSEMPVSYGLEALKVQAVCARSYAYNQMLQNGCGAFGAHVDDSVDYQVYNQVPECRETVEAVDATAGQVLTYKGKGITAYYFSTSCGMTASVNEVWQGEEVLPYLQGGVQREKKIEMDLSKEEHFKTFIQNKEFESYDANFPWYRWEVSCSGEQLGGSIEENLPERLEKSPENILVQQKDGAYAKKKVSSIGTVKKIEVMKRGKSGVLCTIRICGSQETIKVTGEYNIRKLLAPGNSTIHRKDGTQVEGMELLPSGFFYIRQEGENIVFVGGGYGHGVGMSQNGVKTMADQGKTYEEILAHYYPQTSLHTEP